MCGIMGKVLTKDRVFEGTKTILVSGIVLGLVFAVGVYDQRKLQELPKTERDAVLLYRENSQFIENMRRNAMDYLDYVREDLTYKHYKDAQEELQAAGNFIRDGAARCPSETTKIGSQCLGHFSGLRKESSMLSGELEARVKADEGTH